MRRLLAVLFLVVTVVAAQEAVLDTKAKMDEANAAFQQRDYRHALDLYRDVTAADPQNILAHNLAGNCSLELGDFAAAAQSFQRALQIQPDQPQNLAGLVRAYAQAGLTADRDQVLQHLRDLSKAGKLPPNFSYVFDEFRSGDKKVLVTEFPELAGEFHFRYHFNVYDAGNRLVYRYALESDDVDQTYFAQKHPKEAKAGQRSFSLDGYGPNTHATFKFYMDGEPAYADVRGDVEKSLAGSMKPGSQSTYNPQPKQAAPPKQ